MASSYTNLLKFDKPGLGDTGWGTSVNGGFTDMAEQALTGYVQKSVTVAGPNTIPAIASGTSSDGRNQFIELTASPSLASPATLTVPAGNATGNKLYFIKNSAGDAVTITTGGTSVVVPNGKAMMLRVTSTGVEEAMTHAVTLSIGTLTLTNALGATSGGTGQTGYAVGDLLYASSATALSKLAAVATGNVLRSGGVGTAPAWGQVALATDVTGTLPVVSGGTGAATLAANNVLLGNGTSALQAVAPGASGNVLTSNGTTWQSTALSLGLNATVYTSGSGNFTIPTGVTKLKVTVVGGGGGSAGSVEDSTGGAGGGGGTAVKWLTGMTSGNTLAYSVGTGGAAGTSAPGNGGAGNPSTVSSGTQVITTLTGGGGGAGLAGGGGGAGGGATNGDLNVPGGSLGAGTGGGSLFAPPSRYGSLSSALYGGGASSLASANGPGAAGAAGVVIFEW